MRKRAQSEWGTRDEIGALNSLTADMVVQAAMRIRRGAIYRLGHILEIEIPIPRVHGPFFYSTHKTIEYALKHPERSPGMYKRGRGAMTCRMEMGDHTGTHIDALNHISIGNSLYNDIRAREITGIFGTSKLGIETVPPIFCNGVLLDIPKSRHVRVLPDSYQITAKDVKEALQTQNISIPSGCAVLVRTGWETYWKTDNGHYLGKEAGLGMEATEWLSENGAILIGADNFGLEVVPFDLSRSLTVHQYLLAKRGIHIIENLSLNELSAKQTYEFAFVCSPLLIKGLSASPVTPLAIT